MSNTLLNAVRLARWEVLSIMNNKPGMCLKKKFSCTSKTFESFIVKNHDEFLEKVMHSDKPVIVNFHAEWCEPCKILTPELKKMIEPLKDVHLATVDVETNAELVHTFEVKAVPAVIAVRDGLVVDKFVGLVETDMIKNLLTKLNKYNAQRTNS